MNIFIYYLRTEKENEKKGEKRSAKARKIQRITKRRAIEKQTGEPVRSHNRLNPFLVACPLSFEDDDAKPNDFRMDAQPLRKFNEARRATTQLQQLQHGWDKPRDKPRDDAPFVVATLRRGKISRPDRLLR